MTQINIENCDFEFVCNKAWEDLACIDGKDNLRYCSDCKKDVQLIKTKHDIEMAKIFGVCVAVQKTNGLDAHTQIDDEDESQNLFVVRSLVGAIKKS
jgi:hypothetical protein